MTVLFPLYAKKKTKTPRYKNLPEMTPYPPIFWKPIS